jgi:hypothetical protein
VRRESALALRHNHASAVPALWATLADQFDGRDRWYLEALGLGADQQWDACLEVWLSKDANKWNTPAGREIIWRSRGKQTPALLVKIINDKDTPAPFREQAMRAFDFVQGPEKDAALLELVTGGSGK